jgi:hypothetical protein
MMMICDGQKRERPPKTEETEPAMKWYPYGYWTRQVCKDCTEESKIRVWNLILDIKREIQELVTGRNMHLPREWQR